MSAQDAGERLGMISGVRAFTRGRANECEDDDGRLLSRQSRAVGAGQMFLAPANWKLNRGANIGERTLCRHVVVVRGRSGGLICRLRVREG
jgi:hypothetical protein